MSALGASGLIQAAARYLAKQGEGTMLLSLDEKGEWSCALTFGREAPDSPMAGGAAYGFGPTVDDALVEALTECGVST